MYGILYVKKEKGKKKKKNKKGGGIIIAVHTYSTSWDWQVVVGYTNKTVRRCLKFDTYCSFFSFFLPPVFRIYVQ